MDKMCIRDSQEILDNGPLRFTVKLEFTPLTVKGDSTVVETRLITLDAGSHLNKTAAVSYTHLDVYKRQGFISLSGRNIRKRRCG